MFPTQEYNAATLIKFYRGNIVCRNPMYMSSFHLLWHRLVRLITPCLLTMGTMMGATSGRTVNISKHPSHPELCVAFLFAQIFRAVFFPLWFKYCGFCIADIIIYYWGKTEVFPLKCVACGIDNDLILLWSLQDQGFVSCIRDM